MTTMTETTTIRLTENEKALLIAIVESEYQDADKTEDTVGHDIWVDYIDGWSRKCGGQNASKFPGTMSSLSKKGLAVSSYYAKNEQVCHITAAGAAALIATGYDYEARRKEGGW
jgi:hypothetical protein